MKKNIYVLGVGHNTPVFIDYALDSGYTIGGLYHYSSDYNTAIDCGYEILGSFDDLFAMDIAGKNFLLSMGDMKIRKKLTEKILNNGGLLPSIIHPSAVISRYADISKQGVVIGPFSNIQANTIISSNTIILSGVIICHNNTIGSYCFIADGALIGAYTVIENNVFFGQGALSISDKVRNIKKHTIVGARALLTNSTQEDSIMYGLPALNHRNDIKKK